MSPEKISPEEVAKMEGSRTLSDAELIKGGAEYIPTPQGKPRLEITLDELEQIKKEAVAASPEWREKLEGKLEKLAEQIQATARRRDFLARAREADLMQYHRRTDVRERSREETDGWLEKAGTTLDRGSFPLPRGMQIQDLYRKAYRDFVADARGYYAIDRIVRPEVETPNFVDTSDYDVYRQHPNGFLLSEEKREIKTRDDGEFDRTKRYFWDFDPSGAEIVGVEEEIDKGTEKKRRSHWASGAPDDFSMDVLLTKEAEFKNMPDGEEKEQGLKKVRYYNRQILEGLEKRISEGKIETGGDPSDASWKNINEMLPDWHK